MAALETERPIHLTRLAVRALRMNPLSKKESIILWYLVIHLPYLGDYVAHSELSKQTGVNNTWIGIILKKFSEAGFLVRGPKKGPNYHYKLNPAFFRYAE